MGQQRKTAAPTVGVQATAVVTGSILSGAMIGLSAMVIPVFLDTNTDGAHTLRQWVRLYHYGHLMLPALSVTTCGLYGYTMLSVGHDDGGARKSRAIYAAAAAATIAMVPFTWLAMAPTNNTLFGLEEAARISAVGDPGDVRGLVLRWAWLHVVRSVFPLVGVILGFSGVLRENWTTD